MNEAARHLALLTRTTEVVNSSLDLQELLEAIAHEVRRGGTHGSPTSPLLRVAARGRTRRLASRPAKPGSGRRRVGHRRALVNDAARHLALLTRTTEVVNSSLDLQEVLEAIAHEVAAALGTDACFVYLYDERSDELVLRATHGTAIEDATSAPRMRRGEGITGAAAAEREPVMIPSGAHLDPRFKAFPNLREDEYESILAVPILARESSRARSTSARASRGRSPTRRSTS